MKTLLTIAGLDPSSGAGVTADLAVFAAHDFFGTSAVTALTVQSTTGVDGVQVIAPEWLRDTLATLCADMRPAGVKVGMLGSAENVAVVARFLEGLQGVPVVLDPVLVSSSGRPLLEAKGIAAMRDTLLGVVDWVTPNIAELGVLVGAERGVEGGCAELRRQWPGLNIVATGGDRDANDYVCAQEKAWLKGTRIASKATHGTGCAFSSALLCGLLEGLNGVEAGRRAKAYVAEAIRRGPGLGKGLGPMDLFWPLRMG